MKNIKNILNFSVFSLIVVFLSVFFLLKPDLKVSEAERRPLKSFDEVTSAENPFDEFESYFLDQFPFRDSFRAVKAFVNNEILIKNDNNKLYKHNGSVIKLEDKLDEKQTDITINLVNDVIKKFFKDKKVYISVVPDKHYYASAETSRNGSAESGFGRWIAASSCWASFMPRCWRYICSLSGTSSITGRC